MTIPANPERRSAVGRLLAETAHLLDVLFPAGCAICRAAVPGGRPPLCGLCESRVRPVPLPRCPRCGATRLVDEGFDERCPDCASWPSGLRAASACLHGGAAAELVRGFKYRGYAALAPYLAARMLPEARRLASGALPLLVPVPLAPARFRERGFNQAELLSNALAARTGWRTVRLLGRSAAGPSLAKRGRLDRQTIVRSAYALHAGAEPLIRRAPQVMIVDDVITTGSTIAACAEVLARAGAQCLGAVSFTRTTTPLDEA